MRIPWGLVTTALVGGFATPALAADLWVDANAGGGGDGTMGNPFDDLQVGIDAAAPGDTVHALPGTYGPIRTSRHGMDGARITVVSEERRMAVVQADGTALEIGHDFHTFEGLVFDSMFSIEGDAIEGGSNDLELIDVEVMQAGNDCIDLRNSTGVLIASSEIHHCIAEFDPEDNPDAHGITGNSVFDLTVRDCEIYLLTGDALQFSPGRDPWDNVLVERTVMWSGPSDIAVNGWSEGDAIGENAFDSKVGGDLNGSGERPQVTFRDVVAYGWRSSIGNQGAFNVKEEVDFVLDRATIYDSEIAGRLRGPAQLRWQNVVIYDVDIGFRLEDALPSPVFYNSTFGGQVGEAIVDGGGGDPSMPTFQNLLFLAGAVPEVAAGDASNLAVGADVFENADGHDYALVMGSAPTDAGLEIAAVTEDRIGVPRPFGDGYDIGAFEWTDMPPPDDTTDSNSGESGSGNDASTSNTGASDSDSAETGVGPGGNTDGPTAGPGSDTDSAGGGAGEDSGCGCNSAPGRAVWGVVCLFACIGGRRRRRR